MNVGFIGLGRMGQGMAGCLLDDGHDLLIYNPTQQKAIDLVSRGAIAALTPAAATSDRDVVITMLPNDSALAAVLDSEGGLIEGMSTECIHMAMGTHGVQAIKEACEQHHHAGQTFIACPVLGRPDLAANGLLTLVPGGPIQAVDIVRPLLECMGQRIIPVGGSPQAATAMKIANNFVLGCAIEAMGEAFSLVEKLGANPEQFHDVLVNGLFGAPAYEVYGKLITTGAWESGGATAVVGLKDAALAIEAAETAEMPLPSAFIWRDYLASAIKRGEGHLDWAVMAKEQARAAGLQD